MTCTRCPNPTPITVEQAGVELCRVCADLGAEKDDGPHEASHQSLAKRAIAWPEPRVPPPARPARSKR